MLEIHNAAQNLVSLFQCLKTFNQLKNLELQPSLTDGTLRPSENGMELGKELMKEKVENKCHEI